MLMTKDAIIEELRKLSQKERHEIADVIFEMDEEDIHLGDEESSLTKEQLAELERH